MEDGAARRNCNAGGTVMATEDRQAEFVRQLSEFTQVLEE